MKDEMNMNLKSNIYKIYLRISAAVLNKVR